MIFLQISAPFASFKHSYSREYGDTYSLPTPATIYGCLLSLVGETNLQVHRGVKLAIALLSEPQVATVLRTVRRMKSKDINARENSRPDYQSILCGLDIVVGIDSTQESGNLEARVRQALLHPDTIDRFGGWSLGESRDLIDDVRILPNLPSAARWLVKDDRGRYNLPLVVDYLGSKETQKQKFCLGDFCEEAFCVIP
ncbi:type I-MYXAN CRISPR-associated protein Cas5/Cmx5/DevS [Floridanema flaviceps]